MQTFYKFFYRQFGVRRLNNLLSPRPFVLMDLPRESMIHYLSEDEEIYDIDSSKLYFKNYNKKILVDYPEELIGNLGVPKRRTIVIKTQFRKFHLDHKNFRYYKDHYLVIKDPLTLLVNNYSYLNELYRYINTPMSVYNKWYNLQTTIWTDINKVAESSNRNNFIFINIPNELPSYSMLKIYSNKVNTTLLKVFDTPDQLFILEIWKWLDVDNRSNSVISKVSVNNLNKVNLVFNTKDNRSIIINLGYLNSWIKDQENVTEFNTVNQLNFIMLQKIFLKFLITVNSEIVETNDEINTTGATTIKDPLDAEEDKEIHEEYESYHKDHTDDEEEINSSVDIDNSEIIKSNKPKELDKSNLSNKVIDSNLYESSALDVQMDDIDKELKILDNIYNKTLKDKGVHVNKNGELLEQPDEYIEDIPVEQIISEVYTNKTSEESLHDQINEYVEYGLMSAADYKKAIADVAKFKTIKNPYDSSKLLIDSNNVTVEDIQLNTEKNSISTSNNVLDKSMNESSLISIDSDYINNVMQKDTLSMVSSLQKAGVIIRNYEIEEDHSALGTYENHTIEFKPLNGQTSTIRVRVPKIKEDGSFLANSNKYISRKQKVDLPIRKIDPITVALTSYYGKTFVSLSDKVANSSISWLTKQINKASMEEGVYITKVDNAFVYDNEFIAPFIYNALAENYKIITTEDLTLIFDYTDRIKFFQPNVKELTDYKLDKLKKLETNGRILVGNTKKNNPVFVDRNNEFFVYENNTYNSIGSIYNVLRLDQSKSPIDFAEVRIFSKTIPIVLVISYYIGFKKLLKLLNVKYRIVEARKNKNLEDHEYAISFKDISYVFSKKDLKATVILSGLLTYEKQIKQYDFKEFDKKNVYYNMIESKGLSALYIREMDLTNKLFVDPITKNILEEMKEPTTFIGLLLRSSEMLLDYNHPDPQDGNYMRIRGYERIPGVIYKELTAAIREYNNRNISGKSKIDISPYKVWQTIMKDPANKLAEDINPIQNLKEKEIVTYVGEGGRNKDTIVKESRAFHENDIGVMSESTSDSSDVGINTYLTANPNFKNMRGMPVDDKNINATSMLSTSALLAPGATNDDPKRVLTSSLCK